MRGRDAAALVLLSDHPASHGGPDWQVELHADPTALDGAAWNDLLSGSPRPTPFMRHEWLVAMHRHGCATPETGWTPVFMTARPGAEQPWAAACALYLKAHSYGEYVFDWAWADAWERAGGRYWPKLLGASPFTPVPGSRLLGSDAPARRALLEGMRQWARQRKLSSVHLLFPEAADLSAADEAGGWMVRHGVQFHWTQRDDARGPWTDFTDFLSDLQRDKRKKILQERRRVAEAGVRIETREGAAITADDWAFFYRCYERTYRSHGNPPYLNEAFFQEVGRTLADHWLMFRAWQGDEPVAASLIAIDRAQGVAWGRYWGALQPVNCLHFELCYYQPLAWCVAEGFQRFEGGAQGEHKMARGLRPVGTHSLHWLADGRFAQAVQDFLSREGAGMENYLSELDERLPFRPIDPSS